LPQAGLYSLLTIMTTLAIFDETKHLNAQNREFWKARELAKTLEYADYRNFLRVIAKAKEACTGS
jgi:DNA-damage-inducible protein D